MRSRGPEAILAIDQGTSASKAALFSRNGRMIGLGRCPLDTSVGPAGAVDQDPHEILHTQRVAIARALASAGPARLVAAGVASQRSTFVVWDRDTARPRGSAPTWQSTAGAGLCARLERHAARVLRRTGLPLSPHYSASKLSLAISRKPILGTLARRGGLLFGNVATFLTWSFTGGETHATDPTQAARTLLMNLDRLDWDPWLGRLFDVPRAMLPEIRPSLGDFGTLRLPGVEVPIRAMLGDQQAALIGATRDLLEPDGGVDRLVNYGTGAFVLIPTGDRRLTRSGLLTSLAFTGPDRRSWLLEGTINSAGSLLDWLRRELGGPAGIREIDRACARGAGSASVLPAFHGLGSLFFDRAGAGLPALILEPPSTGTVDSLVRAAVESIAHMVALILETAPAGPRRSRIRLVASGPLSELRYLTRYQAALLAGTPVLVSCEKEATLRGIARAAAIASGGAIAREAAGWKPAVARVVVPRGLAREAASRYAKWKRMVRWAKRWK